MGTRLSSPTRWLLTGLGLSLLLLLLLFPPFQYGFPGARGLRQWHFFLDAQVPTEMVSGLRITRAGTVDWPTLFLEALLLWVAMGVAWYVVRGPARSLRPD